jgi:hypothetical protein
MNHRLKRLASPLLDQPTQIHPAVSPLGNFTGAIALSSLLPQAPTLAIEVRSRYMFAWAALAILLGVLAAGYLYQQLGLSRRKRILREMMVNTINGEYCPRYRENSVVGPRGASAVVWDPEIDCPLADNPNWTYYTDLNDPSNIYTALYWARNDADLDEAQAAALTVVRTVKTWLLALTDVRDLWELAEAPREKQAQWDDTKAAWDTRLLLSKARHAPADPAACAMLLAKVKQQTVWHRALAEAWDVRAKLIGLADGDTSEQATHIDLAGLAAEAKPILGRNEDEQDELELKLEKMRGELIKLVGKANDDPATGSVEFVPLPEFEREAVSGRLRSELAVLNSPGRIDFARIQAIGAIAPDHHDDGSVQVVAGMDGADGGEVATAARATHVARGRPPAPPIAHARTRITRRLQLLDLMLSFAILLAISLLYAVGIYGPSWGSIADWASAFGAGFLGQVTVKWALLPIYQSLRPRGPTNGPEASAIGSGSGG